MIDLNEINRDPWPTFPVNKDDLRSLLAENARMKDGLDDLCDFILRARCVSADKDEMFDLIFDMLPQNPEPSP